MKFILPVILFICFASVANAQKNNTQPLGSTYAVIVGISKYENLSIDEQLDFADKDATVFADYLKSKAGGSVPEENIRLLINETATFSAIYEAINWLTEKCGKDDKAYFYFSGHGDLENFTIAQDGYLISYNTPKGNYVYNAVSIDYLNKIANTLSVRNNGKVILITDACHSGSLAGNKSGPYLAAEQLRKTAANEIRMTSCDKNQLSNENTVWGGGHGAFSYYLIKGLQGQADIKPDGIITVNEIKNFMDSCFNADPLLSQKNNKQTPVIDGNEKFTLAAIDKVYFDSLKAAARDAQPPLVMLAPLAPKVEIFFFKALAQIQIQKIIDFKKLLALPAEKIPFEFISLLADSSSYTNASHEDKKALQIFTPQLFTNLEKKLQSNEYALKEFTGNLVVYLSDYGQKIINAYLDDNEQELENRSYYMAESSHYDVFPMMYAVAAKLSTAGHELYNSLIVKQHYFAGVAARLAMPAVKLTEQEKLVDIALAEQKIALALEPVKAAYIKNELGTLYWYKKDFAAAEKYYLEAIETAPGWAIPVSNLAGLYIAKKQYALADSALKKAMALQPRLKSIYNNSGQLYEKRGNLLMAEEMYQKSTRINFRHYLPFENLGYVYMATTQYALADSFFYEADIRKKGFYFRKRVGIGVDPSDVDIPALPPPCTFDSNDVKKEDALGNFALGMVAFNEQRWTDAEIHLKKTIAIDKSNPLAFHYLGKILYNQQRWQEADIIFNLAVKYYLPRPVFKHYIDSAAKKLPPTKSKECIKKFSEHYQYDEINNHYFLGTLYEEWNHYAEAEKEYRIIIDSSKNDIAGYLLLTSLQEKMERWYEAEETFKLFTAVDENAGRRELREFYRKMVERQPTNAEWYFKAGLNLYHIAQRNPAWYEDDKKKISPDFKNAEYIKVPTEPGSDRYWATRTVASGAKGHYPGIGKTYKTAEFTFLPRTEAIDYLLKADSLLQNDTEAIADINYKLGDLYVWQDIPQFASKHYLKSVTLKPNNANARHQLADTYSASYLYANALAQLDSLLRRNEINFNKQVMLAKYYIHAGRFDEGKELLATAQIIHPYKIPTITDLNGRLHLMANNPKEALPFYLDYLNTDKKNNQTMYSIALLYAKMNKTTEAWQWLQQAISNGFNYAWVLELDNTWKNYRTQNKWQRMIKKINPKVYTNPDITVIN